MLLLLTITNIGLRFAAIGSATTPRRGQRGCRSATWRSLTARRKFLENLRTSALVADRMGAYFRICEEIDRYNDAIEAVSTPFAAELVVTMNREEKKAEPKEEPREEITSAAGTGTEAEG